MTKTKQRLRAKVWWPGTDKQVKVKCRECFECQLVSAPVKPDPISSTRMPDHPWQHTTCNILGPLPKGDHVFVVVNYYSRYFEVAFLRTVTSRRITEVCDTMFCKRGIPSSVERIMVLSLVKNLRLIFRQMVYSGCQQPRCGHKQTGR